MRVLDLPSGQHAILSDTVGFVADLPTDLIAAFRARWRRCAPRIWCCTYATWLTPSAAQRQDVLEVLRSLELAELEDEGRLLEFWNKLDLLPAEDRAQLRSAAERPAGDGMRFRSDRRGSRRCSRLLDRSLSAAARWSSWSSTAPMASGSPGCIATAPSWNGATAMGGRT